MKIYLLTVTLWVVLALTTLALVIRDNNSLLAALVAWTGGIFTYRLFEQTVKLYRARKSV